MAKSHSAFVGEIPRNYEKYLGPLIFSEYAEDLANRINIPTGASLLEIAAGTGMATRQLRNTLPKDIRIMATDLNEDMLNVAQKKFDASENIEFKIANALELPFNDAMFEAVACQFSMMFFPDKLLALKEAARVLKPGGKFHFNIWDSFEHNHLVQTVNRTIAKCLPENPPDFYNVPYGYYQIDKIKALLFEAGFAEIEIFVLPKISTTDEARNVAMGFVMGTPARLQIEQSAPDSLAKIVDTVEHAIGNKFGYGAVEAKMQAIVFTAHFSGK